MLVYILNKDGMPLMPCSPKVARNLLRDDKAKAVQRTPFTIQLLYGSSGYKQYIILGVDTGSKVIGLSATTNRKEVFSAEVQLRTDIVRNIANKKQFRRVRRSRKTRYRQARFLNRRKPIGWLAPSIRQKIDTHLTIIDRVHGLLPITNIIVEVAAFDIQKIKDPNISGTEYQEGEQLDFSNTREYILYRDNHTCQHCNGKSKDKILNVHHIESRKTGGDSPGNLVTLCKTCHDAYHTGNVDLNIRRGSSYRDATFMGIMRRILYNKLLVLYPNVSMTYGYITKNTRIVNNLPKEHRSDALCITGNPDIIRDNMWYFYRKVRCQNRKIHMMTINKGGTRKLCQSPYIIHGFRLFDKVRYDSTDYFIFARRLSGSFNISLLDGVTLSRDIIYKKLTLLERRNTILIERNYR